MKSTKYFLIIPFILIIFSFMGCEQQPDINKIKSQVNSLNDIMSKAIMENDHETTLKLFTEDAISMPSYQPLMKGIEAIKKNSEMQKDMPMDMKEFVLNSTDVWTGGNLVVDIGTYKLSMGMPNAPGGVFDDHGKYMTIYEIQKDGSLLIKADTWNTDLNPWMMMQHEKEEK